MTYDKLITLYEKNCILFYQGACNKIQLDSHSKHLTSFYNVSNVYETINVLLFPGISNEQARIQHENRRLSPVLLNNLPELIKVYCGLYAAICKYSVFSQRDGELITYRCDRMNSLNFLQRGQTPSFMSTSYDREGTYAFQEKKELLLLEIHSPSFIEHLDMNDILGTDNPHPKEHEILFPPFLHVDIEKADITAEESLYTDIDNIGPQSKYTIFVRGSLSSASGKSQEYEMLELYNKILDSSSIANAKEVWRILENNLELDSDLINGYQQWKQDLQVYLKWRFSQIKWQTEHLKKEDHRLECLKQEVFDFKQNTNSNRVKYKSNLVKLNMSLSILYPLATFSLALSFWESLDPAAKIASLLINTICLILTGIKRSLTLEGKVQQRTITFLRLDELERDLRYDMDMTTDKLEQYIKRFKNIVQEDDALCKENIQTQIQYSQTISSNGTENMLNINTHSQ